MSAISVGGCGSVTYLILCGQDNESLYVLMQHSPTEIKEKLLKALDKDNNVVNMVAVIEIVSILEKIPITKDELEKTRLGKYINELRKKTSNEMLAKRAKDLVRKWRKLILPQDGAGGGGNSGVNGERTVVTHLSTAITNISHLPGPGPGNFKPASPALSYNQRKVVVPSSYTSPGNSQCSSASTSPLVVTTTTRLASGRPNTPIASASSSSTAINSISTKSPQCTSHGVLRQLSSKPPSPATVSTECTSARGLTTRGLKRNRCVDEDSNCETQELVNVSYNHKTQCFPTAPILNGGDAGDSVDSTQSHGEIATEDAAVSSEKTRGRRKLHVKDEKADVLREKLASQVRTPKVKTTAELIQELKARNSSSVADALALSSAVNSNVRSSYELEQNLVVARQAMYSSLLGTDEDVTRNKTQLMEKFLNDSMDGSDKKDYGQDDNPSSPLYNSCADSVSAILRTLPPIDPESIRWDDDELEVSQLAEDSERKPVTDEMVTKLQDENWECMNGNTDDSGNFTRWNNSLTRRSFNEELLHILPYVDID